MDDEEKIQQEERRKTLKGKRDREEIVLSVCECMNREETVTMRKRKQKERVTFSGTGCLHGLILLSMYYSLGSTIAAIRSLYGQSVIKGQREALTVTSYRVFGCTDCSHK